MGVVEKGDKYKEEGSIKGRDEGRGGAWRGFHRYKKGGCAKETTFDRRKQEIGASEARESELLSKVDKRTSFLNMESRSKFGITRRARSKILPMCQAFHPLAATYSCTPHN